MTSTADRGPGEFDVKFRIADAGDASAIATLHAHSWQRHYRGAYSDAYLDGPVFADRQAEWIRRLGSHTDNWFTLLATAGDRLAGFSHVWLDGESPWGALLDNLHVVFDRQRIGLGTRLMAATAQRLLEERPGEGLYLWVLEQNNAAQAFYQARGGAFEDRRAVNPPMGKADYLVGEPWAIRVVWPDPAVLV